jgi:glutathione synthase/RimK-type ligase-like ATP-grasp enzyme
MTKPSIGMAFTKDFSGNDPLGHIGKKLPVYLDLLRGLEQAGYIPYVITRKTYKGGGIYDGAWQFSGGDFTVRSGPVKIDLVYDRCAGIAFPPEGEDSSVWVNNRAFKILAWDKWLGYKKLEKFFPATFELKSEAEVKDHINDIKTDYVVLKPVNGLKGIGIFVGPKADALKFKFSPGYPRYIMQEFVDSSAGISGIAEGRHDLRVVTLNNKIIWSHVREPREGSLKANVAEGGSIREVEIRQIPSEIIEIVREISEKFIDEYDNPAFSVDFGMDKTLGPKLYEINDQFGFPGPEMKQKDVFLKELIANFSGKLS